MTRRLVFVQPCALGLVPCALILVLAAGCAKARADTAPDGPPLEVPAPPPRVLAPLEHPEPVTVEVPEAPPEPAAPARRPARPANGSPAGAEARPAPAPAPAAAETPSAPAPAETRVLRVAPSSSAASAERTVRDLLARAARDLGGVDYRRLSAGGRANYEQSKRFAQQAEQALKDQNFVFAETLADKAATLAAQLLR